MSRVSIGKAFEELLNCTYTRDQNAGNQNSGFGDSRRSVTRSFKIVYVIIDANPVRKAMPEQTGVCQIVMYLTRIASTGTITFQVNFYIL